MTNLVRKYYYCQHFIDLQYLPLNQLSQLYSPWLFAQWGMDILGPFPPATDQQKFLIVAIDYFIKWIEAEPLAHIIENKAKSFFWKSVIYRNGLPHTLVIDNG